MKLFKINAFAIFFIVNLLTSCSSHYKEIIISVDIENPKVQFAIEEIKAAFREKGIEVELGKNKNVDIVIDIDNEIPGLKSEGFRISKTHEIIHLTGVDEAGLMYGGLELAEQIRLFGFEGIQETTQNPYMKMRGTKFNIPLDVRTPSYSDVSDAAQKNIPEMWSFDFWKEYIDNLARYRYNYISLWSLHPFPSLVKVPGYDNVALDDVLRSTVKWNENYDLNGMGFDAPEILQNTEVIRKITIDEKIEFWKKVMAYGKSRNIDFYFITWNIFVYGTEGKYGITDKIDNTVTRDYFRKSIKQIFLTYPDLAGIGLTTGENMYKSSFQEKEDWAYETYALGLLDAATEMPERNFTFIHRQHMAGAKEIAEKFNPLIQQENIRFLFSFKYAKAHVMSATEQPFHKDFVKDIDGMKTIWTLRNDDNYFFRWGAPDFVREFIQNIPFDVSQGFYYGSDQWIWGREFTMKESESHRQLEIVKHWYHWMIWGRLGYNPELPDSRFFKILQYKFPEADAEKLFEAWQAASMIYPVTTGFHWGPLDFQWYIEGCKSRPEYAQNKTGFHDVNRFINLSPHPNSGFQSIPEFVKMTVENGTSNLKSPLVVSTNLHSYAEKAIEIVNSFGEVEDGELLNTLHDIKTMAALGKYYGFKITGSAQLALYHETKDEKYQVAAVAELEKALDAWRKYAETAMQQNINPIWTNRVGIVNWQQISSWVAHDIEIARE